MKKSLLPVLIPVWIMLTVTVQGVGQKILSVEGKNFEYTPRVAVSAVLPPPPQNARFRSMDGTNNNIQPGRTEWGATEIKLAREIPATYGKADPLNAVAGDSRPSARQISNVLCDEPETVFNSRKLSAFVYVWGQFLDHDINLTPTGATESSPIALPSDETVFTVEIPFKRSEVFAGTGKNFIKREQKNLVTAWIDGSNVYGSDETRANWLRTFKDGKLKVSEGDLLPYNTITGQYTADIDQAAPSMVNDKNRTVKTFVAGDIRASEHPALISVHTLFVREHNKICDRLQSSGIYNDDEIYQLARKEVGALIQQITYNEFLPAMGVLLRPYKAYNPNINADIANTFATAAYRLGHSMVADDILLTDKECAEFGPGELDLLEVFWNPDLIRQYDIKYFLKGLAVHNQYETDLKVNSVLRNFLFGDPQATVRFGLDLAAINIQRGRDHGLPDYNTARRFYGIPAVKDFSEITSDKNRAAALRSLYSKVSNIDLWVGLLAEENMPGRSVGRTVHEMLRVQFEKLRDGDFYYFVNDPFLSPNVKRKVTNTKLSDLLKRNTGINSFQANVFVAEECPAGADEQTVSRSETTASVGFTAFPNPAADVINIKFDPSTEIRRLGLYSLDGRQFAGYNILPGDISVNISTEVLPQGTYIVKLAGEEKHSVQKISIFH